MKLKSEKDETTQRGSKHKKDKDAIERSKIIKAIKAHVFGRTCDRVLL